MLSLVDEDASMSLVEFEERLNRASEFLRVLCPSGSPDEDHIKDATLMAELPVHFSEDKYIKD